MTGLIVRTLESSGREFARHANVTDPHPAGSNTTYLAVVDKDGNIASWFQSLYCAFGSRVTVAGRGFALQNRGTSFTLDPKRSPAASVRFTALFRRSWKRATSTSASGSCAAQYSPSHTRGSSRTSSITAWCSKKRRRRRGGQAILHNSRTSVNYAASDPRADEAAIPEPLTRSRE